MHKAQALVEFAITLPVVMLMLVGALDFGRVFLGWVELNNAARIAANYAAQNPYGWGSPGDPGVVAEYDRQIRAEASGINCALPKTLPSPTFPSGTDVGSPARVTLTCRFSLLTPLAGNIFGGGVDVTVSSAFPIRYGVIEGVPVGTIPPTPSPSPSPTASPTPSPGPTATPTPAPTPTPIPMCTVPNLVGEQPNKASKDWADAGFTIPIIFSPKVPPNYKIGHESLNQGTIGSSQQCDSTVVTVTP